MLQWLRKQVCLGFRREYSIIGAELSTPRRLCPVTVTPVVTTLPTEELALHVASTPPSRLPLAHWA